MVMGEEMIQVGHYDSGTDKSCPLTFHKVD